MKNLKLGDYIIYTLILFTTGLFLHTSSPIKRPQTTSNTFVIKTIPVPVLEPHEHNHGDSVIANSHHVISYSIPITTKEDMWVRGVSYSIKNARETALHHADLAILNMSDLTCPNRNARLIASIGEDQLYMPGAAFPKGYAVFIPKGSELFMYSMFHNPKPPVGYGETYYDVSNEILFDLASKEEVPYLRPVNFMRLELTDKPCGEDEDSYVFKVPANVSEFIFGSPEGKKLASSHTFSESGKIIYMGGHIHGWEGGKYLSVYLNGKLIKKYETKKSESNPYTYDTPHGEENILINKGDVISITATYDNNEPESLNGAMGMLGLFFAKD